jgi:hypothetical protein
MKILERTIISALISLCFLLLSVLPVFANGVIPPSDVMTVYAPNGSIFAQVAATEAAEVVSPSSFPTLFSLPSVPVDTSVVNQFTWLFEQGGNPTDGPWSDVFGVVDLGGDTNIVLAFASDIEKVPFPSPISGNFLEEQPGVPYNLTGFLSLDFQRLGYTATFVSDADPVPEPSTFLLLGAGLAGVGLMRRRFKK